MIMVRVTPDPNITTVCTGISASGGIIVAIKPSSTMPPAAPVNTPMKHVTSDASVRPKKARAPMSGVPRNSMNGFDCLMGIGRAPGGHHTQTSPPGLIGESIFLVGKDCRVAPGNDGRESLPHAR